MAFLPSCDPGVEVASTDTESDELRLESEPIIFEITAAGWRASKLTRRGWLESSARTIEDARSALAARIRTALAES